MERKKYLIIAAVTSAIMLFVVYSSFTCAEPGCHNSRWRSSRYCTEHDPFYRGTMTYESNHSRSDNYSGGSTRQSSASSKKTTSSASNGSSSTSKSSSSGKKVEMRQNIQRACVVRSVTGYDGSSVRFGKMLPMMNVTFVHNGQLTVLPFPFKYLREYVNSIM